MSFNSKPDRSHLGSLKYHYCVETCRFSQNKFKAAASDQLNHGAKTVPIRITPIVSTASAIA